MSDKELSSVEWSFDFERVAEMMRRWWLGESRATVAAEMGVTPQYVGQRLAWAGCTALCPARRGHEDSKRQPDPERVEFARALLPHSKVNQLTARQRGALLWQAQGLILVDIAKRMGTSVQAVQSCITGAERRLSRLEAQAGKPMNAKKLDTALGELLDAPEPTEEMQATPCVEYDEPDERNSAEPEPEREPAVTDTVADAPQSPPELTEADFGLPPERPAPPVVPAPVSPYERKPMRLSEMRPKKPERWTLIWSSNDPSTWPTQ
jgi:DNA-binding CsgD family transcriptional regulator